MTVQLLLSLSILVGVHEFGHLIAAKIFGMRVEKFSIGFPPKIWGIQIGETEYSFGAVPLGGFVKITGMIDESLDTETMAQEPKDYEFRSKPAWQRLIVMLGGIIVNVIVGIIIFTGVLYVWGDDYISREEAIKHGVVVGEYGEELGFRTGDKILLINGEEFTEFGDAFGADMLLADDKVVYTIERDGRELEVALSEDQRLSLTTEKNMNSFVDVRSPFVFRKEFAKWSNATEIQEGDRPIRVDTVPVQYYNEFSEALAARANRTTNITVLRGEEEVVLDGISVNEDGKIGVGVRTEVEFSNTPYSFGQAISAAPGKAFGVVISQIQFFGKIFQGKIRPQDSLAGPIKIATIFGGQFDWQKFWSLTAFLSMVLAFMNLLPIPALDGGHVVFLTFEMISGRKFSDKFMLNAQKVGMIILLTLMVFVFANDIWGVITSWLN